MLCLDHMDQSSMLSQSLKFVSYLLSAVNGLLISVFEERSTVCLVSYFRYHICKVVKAKPTFVNDVALGVKTIELCGIFSSGIDA